MISHDNRFLVLLLFELWVAPALWMLRVVCDCVTFSVSCGCVCYGPCVVTRVARAVTVSLML